MTVHDPLCVWYNPNDREFARQPIGASGCTCEIRWETRADERSRTYGGQGWVAQKDVETWLINLREQVEALLTRGIGARVADNELVPYALVERAEVLALLGGEDDE